MLSSSDFLGRARTTVIMTWNKLEYELTEQKYMGKQAAQYEPEDPHYVTTTDERGRKKRSVVSYTGRR